MTSRQRTKFTRRSALTGDSDADQWLRGDKSCGFFRFQAESVLEAIWSQHGDPESMFCRRGMKLPITREELEEYESDWLEGGHTDNLLRFVVDKYYDDDEKQALWVARGDSDQFNWRPGMRRLGAFYEEILYMAFSGVHITCGFTGFMSDKFPQQRLFESIELRRAATFSRARAVLAIAFICTIVFAIVDLSR